MPLAAGTRLGPYEVLALIGAGGMGEVYKARDTRLDRVVALKVSKEQFSERFAYEARTVAALNHPNICTLHDVGPNYLVMEFVEGENLSGPLPIEMALNYARQMAEAIEAAHEKNIIHRDLKPANVRVTPEGVVKVLDFGLAKALEDELPSAPGPDSPTLSMAMTRAGMILGTAAYMSPEQAKGKRADRRADIWAFGVVLYEMLAGRQMFTGETAAETLASVLKESIPFERLPQDTPAAVRDLLGRCLERDSRKRLQAIGEARIILEGPMGGTEVPRQAEARPPKRAWLPWAVSAVLFLALAALAYWHFKPSGPLNMTRFPIALGEGQQFNTSTVRSYVAISQDGTQIAYGANNRIYVRPMKELAARAIPGSEARTGLVYNPTFSPDGQSLAFGLYPESMLMRVPVSGGAATKICDLGTTFGISWGPDGILLGQPAGIMRVADTGGKPELIVKVKEGEQAASPQMLPGGEAVLFTLSPAGLAGDWDKAQIVVQTLKSGARKTLITGGFDARYLPTGHIVYALGGTLFAVPFNLGRLEITPGPVSLVEGVMRGQSAASEFAVSNTGSLIYVPGPVSSQTGQTSLALVDAKGDATPLKQPAPGAYDYPRVSRDGKRVAYQVDDGKESSVWITELSGETAPSRLTLPGTGANRYPIWADGERIAFQSDREGDAGIWWQRADGTGVAERLTKPEKGISHIPDSWSKDGNTFSFTEVKGDGSSSVWTFSMRDRKATLFADFPGASARSSAFSPDGHWLAYHVDSRGPGGSGTVESYVQTFPVSANKHLVPKIGLPHHPLWSLPDGKELFYIAGDRRLISVGVATQPAFRFGLPVQAPRGGFRTHPANNVRSFDILPDGRFIGIVAAGLDQSGTGPPPIQVVLNWFEDLKQRVPVR